uniref:ER membrane protein complex subunit 1 n=1 Tax=Macrostomum lignano TaxID=282301 RepID=A0A1I8J9D3_9PLAT
GGHLLAAAGRLLFAALPLQQRLLAIESPAASSTKAWFSPRLLELGCRPRLLSYRRQSDTLWTACDAGRVLRLSRASSVAAAVADAEIWRVGSAGIRVLRLPDSTANLLVTLEGASASSGDGFALMVAAGVPDFDSRGGSEVDERARLLLPDSIDRADVIPQGDTLLLHSSKNFSQTPLIAVDLTTGKRIPFFSRFFSSNPTGRLVVSERADRVLHLTADTMYLYRVLPSGQLALRMHSSLDAWPLYPQFQTGPDGSERLLALADLPDGGLMAVSPGEATVRLNFDPRTRELKRLAASQFGSLALAYSANSAVFVNTSFASAAGVTSSASTDACQQILFVGLQAVHWLAAELLGHVTAPQLGEGHEEHLVRCVAQSRQQRGVGAGSLLVLLERSISNVDPAIVSHVLFNSVGASVIHSVGFVVAVLLHEAVPARPVLHAGSVAPPLLQAACGVVVSASSVERVIQLVPHDGAECSKQERVLEVLVEEGRLQDAGNDGHAQGGLAVERVGHQRTLAPFESVVRLSGAQMGASLTTSLSSLWMWSTRDVTLARVFVVMVRCRTRAPVVQHVVAVDDLLLLTPGLLERVGEGVHERAQGGHDRVVAEQHGGRRLGGHGRGEQLGQAKQVFQVVNSHQGGWLDPDAQELRRQAHGLGHERLRGDGGVMQPVADVLAQPLKADVQLPELLEALPGRVVNRGADRFEHLFAVGHRVGLGDALDDASVSRIAAGRSRGGHVVGERPAAQTADERLGGLLAQGLAGGRVAAGFKVGDRFGRGFAPMASNEQPVAVPVAEQRVQPQQVVSRILVEVGVLADARLARSTVRSMEADCSTQLSVEHSIALLRHFTMEKLPRAMRPARARSSSNSSTKPPTLRPQTVLGLSLSLSSSCRRVHLPESEPLSLTRRPDDRGVSRPAPGPSLLAVIAQSSRKAAYCLAGQLVSAAVFPFF